MKNILQKNLLLITGISIFFSTILSAAVVPNNTPTNYSNPAEKTAPIPTVKELMNSFNSLSRKEKKERFREVKKELKEYKKLKKSGAEPSTNEVLLVILAILLPPLAVYLHQGEINSKFWISLLLTLLFWIPGVIYALLVIFGEV
jgi:uncharacterized membrane protein YqaE (UPF0057 family)